MFLLKVIKAFESYNLKYALAGGYAVALHGAVRGTVDIDIVIALTLDAYTDVEKVLGSIGLRSRLPVSGPEIYRFRKEYIKNRNLIAWSFSNPNNPLEMVDVIITHNLLDLKTKNVQVNETVVKIIGIKDLIEMKSVSGRPQDLEDIKALKQL